MAEFGGCLWAIIRDAWQNAARVEETTTKSRRLLRGQQKLLLEEARIVADDGEKWKHSL